MASRVGVGCMSALIGAIRMFGAGEAFSISRVTIRNRSA